MGDCELQGDTRLPDQPGVRGRVRVGRKRTERLDERRRGLRAAASSAARGVACLHRRSPPRYITFERYLANQERLRANWRAQRGEGGGAEREGRALLQGLIRCGRCGRQMQVDYSGKTLVPNYTCVRGNQLYGTRRCQSVGGRRIERVVLDAVFEALRPAGIEATLRAIEQPTTSTTPACAQQSWSSNARRSTPTARDDSSTFASRRTGSWRALSSASGNSASPTSARDERSVADSPPTAPIRSPTRRCLVPQAPAQTSQVFDAPSTTDRERKQLLRAILADVVVTVDRDRATRGGYAGRVGGRRFTEHSVPLSGPVATSAAPIRTRSRSCASSPSNTRQADRRDPRPPRTTDRRRHPFTATTCTGCALPQIPPLPSERPATMARWSRSR